MNSLFENSRKNLIDEFESSAVSQPKVPRTCTEPMRVFLRIRPQSPEEMRSKRHGEYMKVENDRTLHVVTPAGANRASGDSYFTFSKIFDGDVSQKTFYDDAVQSFTKEFLDGHNCLIFTYGVSSSGKTYTLLGTPKEAGILPRTLETVIGSFGGRLFKTPKYCPVYYSDVKVLSPEEEEAAERLKDLVLSSVFQNETTGRFEQTLGCSQTSQNSGLHSDSSTDCSWSSQLFEGARFSVDCQDVMNFSMWISFAEIYNEVVFDLFEPYGPSVEKRRLPLKLSEDKAGNTFIKGLREIHVTSVEEAMKLLNVGEKNRKVRDTKLNQCSSRSHCIFTIKIIRFSDTSKPSGFCVNRIAFCDLAGAERQSKAESHGDGLKEAGNINKSLMMLGQCMELMRQKQSTGSSTIKVNYRDSKLTRIFQNFFEGFGKTCLVVNISRGLNLFDETLHVLKFSSMAREVTTQATVLSDTVGVSSNVQRLRQAFMGRNTTVTGRGTLSQTTSSTQDLQASIMALRKQLDGAHQRELQQEAEIRAEAYNEMQEQLKALSSIYREHMAEERMLLEERYDKKIELIMSTMKNRSKRRRMDDSDDEDDGGAAEAQLAEISKLKDELTTERGNVVERDAMISSLQFRLADLERRCHTQGIPDDIKERLCELQNKVTALTEQLDYFLLDNASLRKHLELKETQHDEISEKLNQCNMENLALKAELKRHQEKSKQTDCLRDTTNTTKADKEVDSRWRGDEPTPLKIKQGSLLHQAGNIQYDAGSLKGVEQKHSLATAISRSFRKRGRPAANQNEPVSEEQQVPSDKKNTRRIMTRAAQAKLAHMDAAPEQYLGATADPLAVDIPLTAGTTSTSQPNNQPKSRKLLQKMDSFDVYQPVGEKESKAPGFQKVQEFVARQLRRK